jgi:hypothetical protein
MEMEQMMTHLLAEIRINPEEISSNKAKTDANQAKTDANLSEIREERRAGQGLLKEEMRVKLDVQNERMMACMNSDLEKMEAYLGKTEATDMEANPESEESISVYEEVSKEEAAV